MDGGDVAGVGSVGASGRRGEERRKERGMICKKKRKRFISVTNFSV